MSRIWNIPSPDFSPPEVSLSFLRHPEISAFIVMLHVDRTLRDVCDADSVLVFEPYIDSATVTRSITRWIWLLCFRRKPLCFPNQAKINLFTRAA